MPIAPRIYGHRGCRGLRPENTLPAFLHALEWGVYGLELDVVLSADNQVVVSHEPWLNARFCLSPEGQPLTVEAGKAYNLYHHSYAEISRCDCGQLRHPDYPEQATMPAQKPLLRDVFSAVDAFATDHGLPLPAYSIELKSHPDWDHLYHPAPPEFLAQVLAVVDEFNLRPRTTLLSFDHRMLQAAAPTGLPLCLLIEDELPLAGHLAKLGFVPAFVGPHYPLVTPELLDTCARLSLPIITWTVNDPAEMLRLAQAGVHGITTDYPDRAARVFGV